jgi:hypothetical protein
MVDPAGHRRQSLKLHWQSEVLHLMTFLEMMLTIVADGVLGSVNIARCEGTVVQNTWIDKNQELKNG